MFGVHYFIVQAALSKQICNTLSVDANCKVGIVLIQGTEILPKYYSQIFFSHRTQIKKY